MKRKYLQFLGGGGFLILLVFGLNKYNPYLRTDIFRAFAKGNWYITSEKDTLFTMGYYGVRKYLASNPKNLKMLAKNEEFCSDRMIGRGGCVYGDFLYVTIRSFLPGSVEQDEINGKLLILKKSDLSIVREMIFDIKPVEAKIYENLLVVSGLKGFNIYDLSNPKRPQNVFSYRHPVYREYQGFDFFLREGKLYTAFALFGDGLEIWDITQPQTAKVVSIIPMKNMKPNEKDLSGCQSMDLIVNYPYVYATLGPSSEIFKTEKDIRGMLVYDVSNLDSIKKKVVLIPKSNWYNKQTGDRQPTYLTLYQDSLFLNFAEKGFAIFDISNAANPLYKGNLDISGKNVLIQPVYATESGKLFAGSYYWPTIYGLDIKK